MLRGGFSLFPLGLIPCLLRRLKEEGKSGAASALCQRSWGLHTKTPEVTFTKDDKGKRRCLFFSSWLTFLLPDSLQVHPHLHKWCNFIPFIAEYYSVVCMYHIFFSHSSEDAYVSCSPVYSRNQHDRVKQLYSKKRQQWAIYTFWDRAIIADRPRSPNSHNRCT